MSSKRLALAKRELMLWMVARGLSSHEMRRYLGITRQQHYALRSGRMGETGLYKLLAALYRHSVDRRPIIGMIAHAREENLPSALL